METYKVLAIDDNPSALETIRDRLSVLSDEKIAGFDVDCFSSFASASTAISGVRYDFAIVDLREDQTRDLPQNDAGLELFHHVKRRRFLPTVFYTAYASDLDESEEQQLPFVWCVSKEEPPLLDSAVKELVAGGVLDTARSLTTEVESEVRRYLWEQGGAERISRIQPELSGILFRRVAARLDLFEGGPSLRSGATAARVYLNPPLTDSFRAGDVLQWGSDWWVVLTPACDLVKRSNGRRKADFLRLLGTAEISVIEVNAVRRGEWLRAAHNGAKPRYAVLPEFLNVPQLVLDFQRVWTPCMSKCEDALGEGSLTRVATLDVPYVEELLVRGSHYAGRIGSPDLTWAAFET